MRTHTRSAGLVLVAVALLAGSAACTPSSAPLAARNAVDTEQQALPAATISFTPETATGDVNPGEPVVVNVADGRLTSVLLTGPKERVLAGDLAPDGSSWTSTDPLKLDSHYRIAAVAVDAAGLETERSGYFATVAPRAELETSISPLHGQSVGVGMPVVVRFSERVKNRVAVEAALTVKSSTPVVGSWSWVSDEEVHYRPKQFWPAYAKVRVDVDLKGVNAGRGVWGMRDRTIRFHTGSSMVSVVDVDRLTLTVYRNGEVARVIPVSTGKAGFLTRNGTKVILEKHELKVMDATTIGISPDDPEYYRLDVPYAMRVTWSGEFVHAAPWSVGSQGRENVSHGCVGMSPADAIWLYNLSTVGDVIQVVGSPRPLEPGNGYTDWNVSWADWTAGSALQG